MLRQVDDATLEVTELPVRKWTQDYKEFLEALIKPEGDKAGAPVLADYREHHSDADVHFSLQLLPGQMEPALAAGLHAKFKLTTKMSCGARPAPAALSLPARTLVWPQAMIVAESCMRTQKQQRAVVSLPCIIRASCMTTSPLSAVLYTAQAGVLLMGHVSGLAQGTWCCLTATA